MKLLDPAAPIGLLDFGEIIAIGPPEEIRVNEAVLNAYLGTHAEPKV